MKQIVNRVTNIFQTRELLEHSLFVYILAQQVLRALPEHYLTREEERNLSTAALLHDIGKSGWQDTWYTKPRYMIKNNEWTVMQMHPIQAVNILDKELNINTPGITKIIQEHHERPGGRGSPYNIEPSLPAVILAACDVYAACTEDRSYRPAPLSHKQALEEIRKFAPTEIVLIIQEIAIQYKDAPPKLYAIN